MKRNKIGISMGDPAGIGAEIIVKTLNDSSVYEKCIPIVVGDYEPIKEATEFCKCNLKINIIKDPDEAIGKYGTIDLINLNLLKERGWEYKKPSAICGDASFKYITYVIKLALEKKISATVTAPINKEALHMAGYNYSGHTEIFADYTDTKDYAMMLVSGNLRVIHVSTHVSLLEACKRVKKERVLKVIKLANEGMRMLGIENPRIGVAGLNPHSSENGLFGNEESEEIIPAIQQAVQEGIYVRGPEAPDTVFVKCLGGQYDIIVAMYHDQGHIPLKLNGFILDSNTNTLSSVKGINCTIGLPIIRVSVDHGTAYGKAGEGRANPESMKEALLTAAKVAETF